MASVKNVMWRQKEGIIIDQSHASQSPGHNISPISPIKEKSENLNEHFSTHKHLFINHLNTLLF